MNYSNELSESWEYRHSLLRRQFLSNIVSSLYPIYIKWTINLINYQLSWFQSSSQQRSFPFLINFALFPRLNNCFGACSMRNSNSEFSQSQFLEWNGLSVNFRSINQCSVLINDINDGANASSVWTKVYQSHSSNFNEIFCWLKKCNNIIIKQELNFNNLIKFL